MATRAAIDDVFNPLRSAWPDSTITAIPVVGQNPGSYWFFATSADQWGTVGIVQGTLENVVSQGLARRISRVIDLHGRRLACWTCPYTYAGSGSVYHPRSGVFIMFAHFEHLFYYGPQYQPFYSVLGTVVSTDNARTWRFLGLTVTPHVKYGDWLRYVRAHTHSVTDDEDIGPATYTIVTQAGARWFYVYFFDYNYPITSAPHVAVVRARVDDVVAAATAPRPYAVAWSKFRSGSWNQPGLGGISSVAIAGNPQVWWLGTDVKYDTYLRRYVAALANNSGLYFATSPDALTWSAPTYLGPATSNNKELVTFPTIVGMGADPGAPGRSFYIYAIHRYEALGLRTMTRRLIRLP